MDTGFVEHVAKELASIREQGLYKEEWPILGHQGPVIRVEGTHREAGRQVGEATAQAVRDRVGLLGDAALRAAESRVEVYAAEGTDHTRLNTNLGKVGDKPTERLFEFLGRVLTR